MRALVAILFLTGCAAERNLFKKDPVLVSGAAAVFVGAAAGMLK